MRIVYTDEALSGGHPTVVCLGFFDGVHIGHAELIRQGVEIAQAQGFDTCVHTFDEMPARILKPEEPVQELTPLPRKAELLAALGVKLLAVSAFEKARHMRAADFFQDTLLDRLKARHIVSGFDHRFGYRGEGDVAMLRQLCDAAGIGLSVITPVKTAEGELVSSTAIRGALAAGDFALAERMLGRRVADRP